MWHMQHTRFNVVAFCFAAASHSEEAAKKTLRFLRIFSLFSGSSKTDNFIQSRTRIRLRRLRIPTIAQMKSVSESQSQRASQLAKLVVVALVALAINLETPRSRRPVCIWLSGNNDVLRAVRAREQLLPVNQSPTRQLLSLSLSRSIARSLPHSLSHFLVLDRASRVLEKCSNLVSIAIYVAFARLSHLF